MNPNREDFEVEKINLESAALFRQYGGIEVKLMILLNFSKFLIKLFTSNKRYSNENILIGKILKYQILFLSLKI
jgi:hypothetical protein